MMHYRNRPKPGTSDLTVVVDKHDTVLSATRTGDRWRFKRLHSRVKGKPQRFNDEQEQEMCAFYVDSPETTLDEIGAMFGISGKTASSVIGRYDVPKRSPGIAAAAKNRKKPTPKWHGIERPPGMLYPDEAIKDTLAGYTFHKTVWLVTVTRTITDELSAESLAEIEAHYAGTDARIVRIERKS